MITLQHTIEEIEHLWKVLEAHLTTHQKFMASVQRQVTQVVPPPAAAGQPAAPAQEKLLQDD